MIRFSIILALLACLSGCADNKTNFIFDPGTKLYEEKLTSFTVKPDSAFKTVKMTAKQLTGRNFVGDKTPLLIIGNCYLFGMPEKHQLKLNGYFVHGMTGNAKYFQTDIKLKWGQKSLPSNVKDEDSIRTFVEFVTKGTTQQ